MHPEKPTRMRQVVEGIKRLLRRKPRPEPLDPYQYVGAPRKPKRGSGGAAAVAERPEE